MCGIGGGPCNVDRRLARLASVGLIVLAPRPVACEEESCIPGMTDIRFAEDEGVSKPCPLTRPGDLPAKDDDLLCSGVIIVGVERCVWSCLEGGWSDFVLDARAYIIGLELSPGPFPEPPMGIRVEFRLESDVA